MGFAEHAQNAAAKHGFVFGVAVAVTGGLAFPFGGRTLLEIGAVDTGIVIMMLLSGMKIPARRFQDAVKRPLVTLCALFSIYAVAPLLILGLGPLFGFGSPADRTAGLILGAQATTLATGIVLTETAGGDTAAAVVISLTANLLSAFLTPAVFHFLGDTTVAVDHGAMVRSLLLKIALPVIAGQLLRIPFESFADRNGRRFSRFSQLIVLLILYAGVSAGHEHLTGGLTLIRVLGLAVSLHGTLLVLNSLVANRLSRSPTLRAAFVLTASEKTLPAAILTWRTQFQHLPLGATVAVCYHIIQLTADSLLAPVLLKLPLIRQKDRPRTAGSE